MKKRKHHYVWRHYLRPWSRGGRLFCLRQGRIFPSSLDGVASQRDFYRVEQPNIQESRLLSRLAERATPRELHSAHSGWLRTFDVVFSLARLLESTESASPAAVREVLDEVHNFEEDLHAKYESAAVGQLAALRRGEASFVFDEHECMDFLHFLCLQYFRTAVAQRRVVQALGELPGIDFRRIWKVLRHIHASTVGCVLYEHRASWRVIFLEATASATFITGDQPAINVLAVESPVGDGLQDLVLYYPLTPKRALLLPWRTDVDHGSSLNLRAEEVRKYNQLIAGSSEEQLYGESEAALAQVASRRWQD